LVAVARGFRYSEPRIPVGKRPLAVTGFGLLIGLLLGTIYAVHLHILGDEGKPITWRWAFADYGSFWLAWGLLSGPIAWLVYRFPIGGNRRRNIFYHLAASIIVSPVHSMACYLAMYSMVGKHTLQAFLFMAYLRGMVYYWLIAAGMHALDYYRQYQERALAASQLEAQLAQTKLHLLKTQLHPHFLFNTLNSISALLHEDLEQADLMIERLGDFLRLTLQNSTAQEVTLREELEFLNCYLSIEQIRLQERLVTTIDVPPHMLDVLVPSLILQPIVENAVRHGIAPRASIGRLEINARRHHSSLVLTVQDNGPGLAPAVNGNNGKGMGLAITRARLERLYGNRHKLELVNASQGGLIVTLEMPFQPSNPEQVPNE
jgi:two-component system, LytTR family, sensor kinase